MTGDLNCSRVAVIGATGFVGSHLTEELIRRGASVLAIARSISTSSPFSSSLSPSQVKTCDITELPMLTGVLGDFRPQKVFHLACEPDAGESFLHAEQCIKVNTLGAMNVFEASALSGADRLIFADSVKVYGNATAPARSPSPTDPICSYAVSKAAAWQLLRIFSTLRQMSVVGLRPTFIFGPRQRWNLIRYVLECAANGKSVDLQGGHQTRDPLYVTDAVDAFIRAAFAENAAGHSIPLGGGEEMRVDDMCRTILSKLGSDVAVNTSARPLRPNDILRCYADNTDAARLLGWRPRLSFEQALEVFLGKAFTANRSRAANA